MFINALACFFLLFDTVLEELKSNLHRNKCTIDSYNDLVSDDADQIQSLISGMDVGELAQFLMNCTKQVLCLPHIISA